MGVVAAALFLAVHWSLGKKPIRIHSPSNLCLETVSLRLAMVLYCLW